MKTLCQFASIILVSILAFSCTTTAILTTNFNSQTLGTAPSHDIPGDPSGDRIDYISELVSGLKVITGSTPGNKSLEFSFVNT